MKRILKHGLWSLLSICITLIIILAVITVYFELQLPNVAVLKDVHLQVPLKIYSADGKLMGAFGPERRTPIPISQVPKQLIQAVLATEDQRFFEHDGVDPLGLARAAMELVITGRKIQGGSTITMQVARNYFLTRKKTFTRKFREILLAIKIDHEFSKDKILQLYFNKIYLGNHAYGVAAASQVYYGKPLNQLTLPQLAMLAGLPKAPSALNPLANKHAARDRRDHVLYRMYEKGYINKTTYEKARHTPLTAKFHGQPIQLHAPYIASMIRDAVEQHFGNHAFEEGLKVYTTINSKDQIAANNAVHKALLAYDKRHGYRGAQENWGAFDGQQTTIEAWTQKLDRIRVINGLQPAIVTQVNPNSIQVLNDKGQFLTINWNGLKWTRKEIGNGYVGPVPKQASDIVKVGDVIRIQKMQKNAWELSQIPQVEGALISLNPKDGAIIALVGGFDFYQSNFNRAIQAERQPGSSFKPFIYAAALAKGFTLATTINDAPIVVNDPSEEKLWRPENDTRRFHGPTRLRVGLIQSVNLVSIRLLRDIGPSYAADFAAKFGFNPKRLPHTLSLALGSALVTPLQMATGYAVFANGGYRINPYIISKITNVQGQVIYQAQPQIACESCVNIDNTKNKENEAIPANQKAQRVISPQVAYLMTSAMQTVIKQGTGRAALVLKRTDLAGKTGTTNDQKDAWFSGFNSNIVTTCWVGFDNPRTLHEYGAQAALPMWIDYMGKVLKGSPEHTMPEPPDIVSVRIDPKTGLLARQGQKNAIFEIFRQQDVPTQYTPASVTTNSDQVPQWQQPLF